MDTLEKDLRFHRAAILLIIIVGLIIYSNSISSSFHFDDHENIVRNLILRDIRNIPLLFHRDRNPQDYHGIPYSRALEGSTFALNYYLGGLEVEGYHWVNLSLHILNGILVYFFMGRLLRAGPCGGDTSMGNLPPLFVALFFVANPVQTHGVTYISQRWGEMATLFYLLSLILFIKAVSGDSLRLYPYLEASEKLGRAGVLARPDGQDARPIESFPVSSLRLYSYLGSLSSFLCGLWSKEEVYTAPVMFFLYYLAFVAKDWKWPTLSRVLGLLLPYTVLAGLSFYLGIMPWSWTFEVYWQWNRWEYLLTQASVIVEYLKLLVLPLPRWLNADVDFPISKGLWEGHTLFSIGIIVLLLGTSVLLLKSAGPTGKGGPTLPFKEGRPSFAPLELRMGRLLGFGVLWFFITLSTTSSVIPLQEIMVVYRLYLPSIGFCLVWVICLHKALEYLCSKGGLGTRGASAAEIVVFSVILLGYSVGTYEHNKVWKDEITLWEDTVKKSPVKARAHYGLGVAYGKKDLYAQAISQFEEAIRLKPDYAEAYNNLGWVYGRKGLDDLATRQYDEAIRLKPVCAEAYYNLGVAHYKKGLYDQAIGQFEEAIKLRPNYAEAYNNLGWVYFEKDLYDQAIKQFAKAVMLNPDYAEAYNNLGCAYGEKGLYDQAISQLQEAVRLRPAFADAHCNLGVAYNKKGQYDLAIRHLEQAVQIDPDLEKAHKLLDELYQSKGK